jgi:phospholipid/cholesterol/gamma-HCH transport system substrate-binding protein
METRANYALIGAFTLAVILAGFGFTLWLAGGSHRQVSETVRIVFSGSVGGLSRGSSVTFNGIKVGEVTDIHLAPQDPRRVLAMVKVEPSAATPTPRRSRPAPTASRRRSSPRPPTCRT